MVAWVAWGRGSTHSLFLSVGPSNLRLIGSPWEFYILVLLGLSSYAAGISWVAWGRGSTHSLVLSDGPSNLRLLVSPWEFCILVHLGLFSLVAWLAWVAWGRGSTHSLSDRPGRHLAAVSLLPIVHASRL